MEPSYFGSHSYSQEELVAEMTAAFLCGHCGVEMSTLDNSAAYLAGWLRRLQDDKRLVVFAAAQAQKAADYILGRVPTDDTAPTSTEASASERGPASDVLTQS